MQTTEPSGELRDLVHEDEELQWVVQPKTKARYVTRAIVSIIVGGFVGFFASFTLGGILGAVLDSGIVFLLGFVVGLFGPAALLLGLTAVAYFKHRMEYAATDQRLITYGGTFGRDLDSVPLEKVQDAEFDVGMIENFLDVGTATVDTDRGVESMRFSSVQNPSEVATAINELAQAETEAAAATAE